MHRVPSFLAHPPNRASVVVAALLFASILCGPLAQAGEDEDDTCIAKPYVVNIHADWCGSCRKLEQTWSQVQDELGKQSTVVKLDVSNRVALERSRAEAERLGIGDVFDEYRSRTGTVLILDGRSHRPVAVLEGERDFTKYRRAVELACDTS